MKRRLFVDIYAGCAGITFECKRRKRLGVETEPPWDIEYGVRYDLTIPKNRRRLMNLLGSGLVLVVWWGTPCTTFSIARTPLRKAHDPALPLDWFSDLNMAIFLEGNMLADICAEGMIVAHLAGAFVVMENPWSSAILRYRPIANALICIGATDVRTVFVFLFITYLLQI